MYVRTCLISPLCVVDVVELIITYHIFKSDTNVRTSKDDGEGNRGMGTDVELPSSEVQKYTENCTINL